MGKIRSNEKHKQKIIEEVEKNLLKMKDIKLREKYDFSWRNEDVISTCWRTRESWNFYYKFIEKKRENFVFICSMLNNKWWRQTSDDQEPERIETIWKISTATYTREFFNLILQVVGGNEEQTNLFAITWERMLLVFKF